MIRKLLVWGGFALLAFYVITQPNNAANAAGQIGEGLKGAGTSLVAFVDAVIN
jgi:hypothetical protein